MLGIFLLSSLPTLQKNLFMVSAISWGLEIVSLPSLSDKISVVLDLSLTNWFIVLFLEKSLLSDLSGVKTGRSGDLLGPKDVSYLVDDPPGKAASKIRHDQPDLERSDKKSFSINNSTMSKAR